MPYTGSLIPCRAIGALVCIFAVTRVDPLILLFRTGRLMYISSRVYRCRAPNEGLRISLQTYTHTHKWLSLFGSILVSVNLDSLIELNNPEWLYLNVKWIFDTTNKRLVGLYVSVMCQSLPSFKFSFRARCSSLVFSTSRSDCNSRIVSRQKRTSRKVIKARHNCNGDVRIL